MPTSRLTLLAFARSSLLSHSLPMRCTTRCIALKRSGEHACVATHLCAVTCTQHGSLEYALPRTCTERWCVCVARPQLIASILAVLLSSALVCPFEVRGTDGASLWRFACGGVFAACMVRACCWHGVGMLLAWRGHAVGMARAWRGLEALAARHVPLSLAALHSFHALCAAATGSEGCYRRSLCLRCADRNRRWAANPAFATAVLSRARPVFSKVQVLRIRAVEELAATPPPSTTTTAPTRATAEAGVAVVATGARAPWRRARRASEEEPPPQQQQGLQHMPSEYSLARGFVKLYREGGLELLYSSFGPLLLRELPFTITKFVVFDYTSSAITAAAPALQVSHPKAKCQLCGA
eukprot:6179414-Pleurochrysis_carterae.AAC.2